MSNPFSPESSSSSLSNSPSHTTFYSNENLLNLSHHRVVSQDRTAPQRLNMAPVSITIVNQPQKKFRFRYISEMTGTHGCLMAESRERNKKEYIQVKLNNCQEREAIIRCTLVTSFKEERGRVMGDKPVTHVHKLGGEGSSPTGGSGANGEYQDITVSTSRHEWVATFSGLTIIHTAKKQVREVIERRLMNETKMKLQETGIMMDRNTERQVFTSKI